MERFLGVLAMVLGAALVGTMVVLLIILFFSVRESRRATVCSETPFGTFRLGSFGWEFEGEAPVSLFVRDLEGSPDSVFVSGLPDLLANLDRLDRLAKDAYVFDEENGPYVLKWLSQGDGEEIVLGYGADWDEQGDVETVLITIVGEQVVRTSTVS